MFNFELPIHPDRSKEIPAETGSGLEGMCTECGGKGRIRPGFLKAERVCGKCHGKGFINEEVQPEERSYSWDTGLKH